MTGVNVWWVYLASQNIPSAVVLTLGNKVVYSFSPCIVYVRVFAACFSDTVGFVVEAAVLFWLCTRTYTPHVNKHLTNAHTPLARTHTHHLHALTHTTCTHSHTTWMRSHTHHLHALTHIPLARAHTHTHHLHALTHTHTPLARAHTHTHTHHLHALTHHLHALTHTHTHTTCTRSHTPLARAHTHTTCTRSHTHHLHALTRTTYTRSHTPLTRAHTQTLLPSWTRFVKKFTKIRIKTGC